MSDLLTLITVPDARLRVVSEEITQIDNSIKELFYSMVNTMYNSEGIGLAGIQVGVPKRIIVIDIDNLEENPSFEYPICLINPEVSLINNKTSSMQEGCLSVPGEYVKIVRPSSVSVRYLNLEGQACHMNADGLLSRVIQHEYDHLQGKLLIEYLPYLEQDKILEKASTRYKPF